jgi:site-specific recombinase XerD
LFSFYSGGQNLIDVLKIKWSDINGSVIKLSRSKTSHKARIDINEPLQRILDHYHIHGGANKEGYVFPVLSLENTPQQNRDKFKNHCSRVINPAISKLAKLAGLERGLSSKVARYSFATALHQQNIDTKTISKAMARKNDRGLEGYLGKMDERVKDAITKNLINRPNK